MSRHLRILLLALDVAEGVAHGTNKEAMRKFLDSALNNYGEAMILFKKSEEDDDEESVEDSAALPCLTSTATSAAWVQAVPKQARAQWK